MTQERRTFGSVRTLPSGRFQARYRDRSGRMHSAPHTFRTEAQANRYLASMQTDLDRGTWLDPQKAKTLFEDLALAWSDSRPNLRPTTAATYGSYLSRYILPYFTGTQADQITSETIRAWHGWVSALPRYPKKEGTPEAAAESKPKQPISRNTVAKAYRILRSIMEVAVDDEIIARNPCRLHGVASERSPEQRVATAEEVIQISEAMPERYRAMVLVAAYGGLRLGELCALRRHRIDFNKATIRVVEQVTQPDSKTLVCGPPKTEAGVRTVTMPPEVMAALKDHMKKFAEPGKNGLVFTAPQGGYIRRSNFYRRAWLPAVEKANLTGLRFHDLRHTHATLAVAIGVDIRTLMKRMGHASPRAALIYQHAQSDEIVATGFSKVIAEAKLAAAKTAAKEARANLRAV
ncbi:MAG: site-specific integrase [Ilumatobacteraceae bacterium]|nr:site-specific integrase [Ilumatobacteraceae bacterium]